MKKKTHPKPQKQPPLTMVVALLHSIEGRVERLEQSMQKAQRALPQIDFNDE